MFVDSGRGKKGSDSALRRVRNIFDGMTADRYSTRMLSISTLFPPLWLNHYVLSNLELSYHPNSWPSSTPNLRYAEVPLVPSPSVKLGVAGYHFSAVAALPGVHHENDHTYYALWLTSGMGRVQHHSSPKLGEVGSSKYFGLEERKVRKGEERRRATPG